MVEDPPHVVKTMRDSRKLPVDYAGAGLIALGLGALEVTLDKGQEDDWFSSPFIVCFAVIAVVAITYFIVWEWRERNPILNLRLLRHRNLAVASGMMLLLGAIIFSTTNLVPQYLQSLLGYTAQSAGEALSLGGLTVVCLMPAVGALISRVDPRYLIAFGFLVTSLALIHMTGIYPGIPFAAAAQYRVFQSVGFAFLFVPISTMSYVGISPEDSNQVSAMTNLLRNLGGTIGLSTLSTVLARRQQVHQTFLVAHTYPGNPLFRIRVQGLAHELGRAGAGSVQGLRQAYGSIYHAVQIQATALSYLDAIWIFATAAILAIPTAFIFQRSPPGQAAVAD
jgi:DHA2 family multidrug resistance protein